MNSMTTAKRVAANERIQKIKNCYQYGTIMFFEAVQAIMNLFSDGQISNDEATLAIRQISRIRLPY